VRLPGQPQQDDQNADSQDRSLHRSASDVSHDRLGHALLPFCQDRTGQGCQDRRGQASHNFQLETVSVRNCSSPDVAERRLGERMAGDAIGIESSRYRRP
jgi:hypothetical protein